MLTHSQYRVWTVSWIVGVLSLAVLCYFLGLYTLSWSIFALMVVSFTFELVDSSLGMGYGTMLTPVLLIIGYEPTDIIPTILVSEFLTGSAAAFFHSKAGNVSFTLDSPHTKVTFILILGSLVGVVIGVNLALQISKTLLTLLMGSIVTFAGILIIFNRKRTFIYRTWKMILLAIVASFNKAVSGGGYGPLMTSGQIISGMESKASVAVTSFTEAFTCITGTMLFLWGGKLLNSELLIPVCAGSLLSVPLSATLISQTNEQTFRNTIGYVTAFFGVLVCLNFK